MIEVLVQPPPPEFCLFRIQHWSTCMSKGEWSGWMQAIGSIAALLLTGGLFLWQRHTDVRRHVERYKRNLGTVNRSLTEVWSAINVVLSPPYPEKLPEWYSRSGAPYLRDALELLEQTPYADVDDEWYTDCVRRFIRDVKQGCRMLDQNQFPSVLNNANAISDQVRWTYGGEERRDWLSLEDLPAGFRTPQRADPLAK